ncbi:MAG: VWA domain-containing protein [Porphyromonas somerae]|uniref:vWA domain-containing protein n=1 Tax=Porphyromonas somerae TaxID=322095 RepID=UPI0026F16D52|nr:VWA domain-containing protein [Porphyromonas somerae]MDD7557516.1 VWA domain-containing protein [Porphyromonas somerae]MDY3119395.1 VWA domain-containing protein [Porphyromonas somerae]MDY5815221.1 VWA domain-containing protein [Porphyromonas somerae]
MTFAHPYFFLLLLLVPLAIGLYLWREKRPATFTLSTIGAFRGRKVSWRTRLCWLPFALALLAFISGVVALARPQSSNAYSTESTEGINIVLALDISGSMLAKDLQPNRFEAAKSVAGEFVSSRPYDNIGLVVFAGESYTQCPLTTDHAVLLNMINGVEMGLVNDGTAIGSGLATAVNRLKEIKEGSKVVILLTDGTNNSGTIAPVTAAEIAASFGIRVYTIGVGTMGEALYPIQTYLGVEYVSMPVEIDEASLKQIASATGGQYFRATDNNSLHKIYEEIDQLEKVKLKVESFTQKEELFPPYLWAALILLFASLLLRSTLFRRMP